MKTLKRTLALILALTMVMALSVTAFAANSAPDPELDRDTHIHTSAEVLAYLEKTGSTETEDDWWSAVLVRDPGASCWDTGNGSDFEYCFNFYYEGLCTDDCLPETEPTHTYAAYQIFSGSQAADSSELGDIKWGSGIDGEKFLAALQDDTTLGTIFADCETAKDVAEQMTGTAWGDNSDNAKAFAKIAHNFIKGNGATPGETLDSGYYLVVDETAFTEENPQPEDFAYNLSLLQLTQKGTFEVKTKVDVPSVDKTVDDVNDTTATTETGKKSADYDIGDDVPFTLTATLGTIADYETYKVVFHDTLSAGFTRNNDVAVMLDDEDVTDDFTIGTVGTDGKFTVSCDDVKALGAEDGSVIVVTYTAKLTGEGVVIGDDGNENSVYLEYSNKPNWDGQGNPPTGETPESTVVVFTYEVDANKIEKINGENKPLAGATFELLKKVPNPDFDKEEDESDENPAYIWETKGTCVAAEVKGEDGETVISYTANWKGVDDGTYKLVETVTPNGYNTMADIEFTITATHTDEGITSLEGGTFKAKNDDASAGILTSDIENNKGSTLPETGGIGTTIFYVIGGILLVGAAVLLITKKRMGVEA